MPLPKGARRIYADGWYWFDGKVYTRSYLRDPKGAVMIRLWTGTPGIQQAYVQGRTRLYPRQRDMVKQSGKLVSVPFPAKIDKEW